MALYGSAGDGNPSTRSCACNGVGGNAKRAIVGVFALGKQTRHKTSHSVKMSHTRNSQTQRLTHVSGVSFRIFVNAHARAASDISGFGASHCITLRGGCALMSPCLVCSRFPPFLRPTTVSCGCRHTHRLEVQPHRWVFTPSRPLPRLRPISNLAIQVYTQSGGGGHRAPVGSCATRTCCFQGGAPSRGHHPSTAACPETA